MKNRRGCPYRGKVGGRSFVVVRSTGGAAVYQAGLTCTRCNAGGTASARADATPHTLDAKFRMLGWQVSPSICPACLTKPKGEKMTAPAKAPSPAAMKAQVEMIRLLTDHFDTADGRYAAGWSDDRVAKETNMSKAMVIEFRKAGFGEIKEDPAIADIRADINALEQLQREHDAGVAQQLAELRMRLGKVAGAVA